MLARGQGHQPGDAAWPEAAYNGDYVADIARDYLAGATVAAKDGEPVKAAGRACRPRFAAPLLVAYLRHEQDLDLQAFGVQFDCYFLESSLYSEGRVAEAVDRLIAAGKTYELDGALWLRTTDDGDDKDRVMRKSDGTFTYFVPDVAYHLAKWQRGFTKAINIQGTDHHGTIARVRAGLQGLGLGIPKGYPDYVLHKMVTVMRNGQEVKISKRAGSYVTLRDLIVWSGGGSTQADAAPGGGLDSPEVIQRGRDAVRFFLISRKADTEFVFDVDLALKQNDENPVYYVQYAHARISSILNTWVAEHGGDLASLPALDAAAVAPLESERAQALLQRLAEYPEMLAHAADELAPHAVAFYLRELGRRIPLVLRHRPRARRRRRAAHGPDRAACRDASGARERPGDDRRQRPAENVTGPSIIDHRFRDFIRDGNKTSDISKQGAAPSKQGGGTFVGIVLGLIVGLAIAVIVALYITRSPTPFVAKLAGGGASDASSASDVRPEPLAARQDAGPGGPGAEPARAGRKWGARSSRRSSKCRRRRRASRMRRRSCPVAAARSSIPTTRTRARRPRRRPRRRKSPPRAQAMRPRPPSKPGLERPGQRRELGLRAPGRRLQDRGRCRAAARASRVPGLRVEGHAARRQRRHVLPRAHRPVHEVRRHECSAPAPVRRGHRYRRDPLPEGTVKRR